MTHIIVLVIKALVYEKLVKRVPRTDIRWFCICDKATETASNPLLCFWSSILFISNLHCPRPQQTRSNCISTRAYLKSKSQPDVSIVHTKEQEDSSPFGFAMEAD
jgi:hypothetical protein